MNVRIVLSMIIAYAMIALSFLSLSPKARWILAGLWLFDIVFAGSNTARWTSDGKWGEDDQRKSDHYQLLYATVSLLMIGYIGWRVSIRDGLIMLVTYATYGEDVGFYVFMPLFRWTTALVNWFAIGEWLPFDSPMGIIKKKISGWFGWVGRQLNGEKPLFLKSWEALIISCMGTVANIFFSKGIVENIPYACTVLFTFAMVIILAMNNGDFKLWLDSEKLEIGRK